MNAYNPAFDLAVTFGSLGIIAGMLFNRLLVGLFSLFITACSTLIGLVLWAGTPNHHAKGGTR